MKGKTIAIIVICLIVLIGLGLLIGGLVATAQHKSNAYPLSVSGAVLTILFSVILYFVLRS